MPPIMTSSVAAAATLSRTTVAMGAWRSYGNDGRLSTTRDGADAGFGFRARFSDNPHGEDYGWGPLASTSDAAIVLLYAEYIETVSE